MSTTGIKLPEQIRERIKTLGQKMDRSSHWIMKTAIERYLDDQERYWREREEDMQEWQDYLAVGEGVPHGQVKAWLESIGTKEEKECPR